MNSLLSSNKIIAFGHKISRKGRVTLTSLDFLFVRGLNLFQGVLHSSPLPDYIEDKKSGGQQTDCLIKNGYALSNSHHRTCRDVKADAKNRNKVLANRYS
jgi:hypothetical protein